jgi:DNA-binding MarR family transcriptional regulator
VLVHLASSPGGEEGFVALQEALGLSGGNLSVQLRTLSEAGLVVLTKGYRGNRPSTTVRLTVRGHEALAGYVSEIEGMIRGLREASRKRRSNA